MASKMVLRCERERERERAIDFEQRLLTRAWARRKSYTESGTIIHGFIKVYGDEDGYGKITTKRLFYRGNK